MCVEEQRRGGVTLEGARYSGIRNFVARANLPKGAKELTARSGGISRLPRTRFQAAREDSRERKTRHKEPRARDCTAMYRQRTGTHFCGQPLRAVGAGKTETCRTRGARRRRALSRRERTPRGGSAANRRHEWRWEEDVAGTRRGMINTRALFSDFLPRDLRAQIACK